MKTVSVKIMAILLAVLMCVCLIDSRIFADDGSSGPVFESDGLTYTFTLQGSWNSGYNASVRIDNHTGAIVEDWKFEMVYGGGISNIWNAVIESNTDGKYVIKNAVWNQDIAVGGYVEFGFSGSEAFVKYPTSYKMLNGIVENSNDDFTAGFEVVNDWTTGYTGRITISNTSDSVIEDWVLEFDGENEISSLWDGELVSHDGTHYVVKSAAYNQNIAVGSSVSFNFNVDHKSSDEGFSNFILKSMSDIPQTNPGNDDITDPGDVDDVDIGEIYFKDFTEEDIATDEESGTRYIRNQLLVSGFIGVEKSIFEEIFDEIGATIVGYIEFSNDYQIEFVEDKTYEELIDLSEYLNSFSFVWDVTLNQVYDNEVNVTSNDTLYNDNRTCEVATEDGKGSLSYNGQSDSWSQSSPSNDVWGLVALHVPEAWNHSSSFSPVKVGVYDNYFARHDDLNYCEIKGPSMDTSVYDFGHGTHVAGILAATHNNNCGISGVATDARLYAYGGATLQNTSKKSDVHEKTALGYLIGKQVRVINVSIGDNNAKVYAANFGTDEYKDVARDEIYHSARVLGEYLKKLIVAEYDFVICTSAGNLNGKRFIDYQDSIYGYAEVVPGDFSYDMAYVCSDPNTFFNSGLTAIEDEAVKNRIIVVASMDQSFTLSSFSNVGSRVDVAGPGEDILSTVPTSYNSDGYTLLSGTSMASPHIAGVVALMFQADPHLQADAVKNILINSASSRTSGQYSYPIPNAEVCVEKAIEFNDYEDEISWPSGTLNGTTISANGALLSNVRLTAYRKNSGDYNVGTYTAGKYSFIFSTDDEGSFVKVLPQGVYDITVYKDGYLPYSISNVTIRPNETKTLEPIKLQKWNSAASSGTQNSVYGHITNAINGNPVPGVTIKLRKGWNMTGGAYVVDSRRNLSIATTMANGDFVFYVPAGAYTAEISKDGFVTGYYNVVSMDNDSAISNRISMVISPTLDDNEYRIVLTWGETPRDLDSHLTYYVDNEQVSHIYFGHRSDSYQGDTLAVLDYDDRDSFGPETVTITFNADYVADNGCFIYSVHDFSNRDSTNSTELSMSDAVVHFYKGNELYDIYRIQKNKVATEWRVFKIDKNGIRVLDGYKNQSDVYQVAQQS